jgi:2Fe-2S ferredoxin
MNTTVEAKAGQSLLEVAMEHDIPLAHACGGFCACTTCHVFLKSGDENLTEMQEDEEDRLDRLSTLTLRSRLGCQAKVQGDVTVEIENIGTGH